MESKTAFALERDFEDALVQVLTHGKGWEEEVLASPTEAELVENWRRILSDNNKGIDTLNGCPLTDGEMRQVLAEVNKRRTPAELNRFINGRSVSIRRDNPDDADHFGQTVSLKIYSRNEIAGGTSRYQVARQPRFSAASAVRNPGRGDVMLLVNGMPVIHIELKRSGVPVERAARQIATYASEGAFTGLFAMVQVFVAMSPEDAVYFANPGPDGVFDPKFCFHWADERNAPCRTWTSVAERLLNIPMAHQLIGFYSVADASDGVLKVMRSYQYYAASRMLGQVTEAGAFDGGRRPRGGYVWHTTGSGKTMTSYKAAQLIRDTGRVDKVVFLLDRTELSMQSLKSYLAFAGEDEVVRDTENTRELVAYLESDMPDDSLIVTSIQKMGFLDDDEEMRFLKPAQLEKINDKKLVFVVDECHRSVFGKRMGAIKRTFPKAVLFGFTGTPIKAENAKKGITTADIFGDCLHSYTLANGIADGNVLGFYKQAMRAYDDDDLRRAIALMKAKAEDEPEVWEDPRKTKVYNHWMREVPMAADSGESIEKLVPASMYDTDDYRREVVRLILATWPAASQGGRLHAMLATSSIKEAIEYYRLLKATGLAVTAVFDDSDPTCTDAVFKREGLDEITADYNERFGFNFKSGDGNLKADAAARLAHKGAYKRLEKGQQLDLLVVVDQMLTGYDSAWLGTLYLDKVLEYEHLIQAFSRTNRLLRSNAVAKPFGTVYYFRNPHTMELNIAKAVEMYSDGNEVDLFADRVDENVACVNRCLAAIEELFAREGIEGFSRLPEDAAVRAKFAAEFSALVSHLEAAQIQGFVLDRGTVEVEAEDGALMQATCGLTREVYDLLTLRYRDLSSGRTGGGDDDSGGEPPYDLDPHIMAISSERIDADYMQSRFLKWLEARDIPDMAQAALDELHSQFAWLSESDQVYAEKVISGIQDGSIEVVEGKGLMQYIVERRQHAQSARSDALADALGLDRAALASLMATCPSEEALDAHGRWTELIDSVDKERALGYFSALLGRPVKQREANRMARELVRRFVLAGGFDLVEGGEGR